MRAVLAEDGRIDFAEVAEPELGPGQVRVRVHAAGLNRADLAHRAGTRRAGGPGGPNIMGAEMAGEIVEVGALVSGLAIGDRVMAMARGSFADEVVLDQELALPVPADMGYLEAAALPVAYITAHDAIVTQARLAWGETFLVNAASSGIGVASLQIASLLGARPVIAVCRGRDKLDELERRGLAFDVALTLDGVAEQLRNRVDVIVDNVGGATLAGTVDVAAVGGRIISVGRLGGNRSEFDLDELARKQIRLIGVTFRTRSRIDRIEVTRRFRRQMLPAIADGALRPVVHAVFPYDDVGIALEQMTDNAHVGKLVVQVA